MSQETAGVGGDTRKGGIGAGPVPIVRSECQSARPKECSVRLLCHLYLGLG